ncbi:hypothetical protein [Mesomycoplasma neurolyticum]|uniref:Uncharacterized protein n=1 Tax=Mesomycoplasma neurolyticum TaxID=2120 RepID=A0A449A5S0_9BACT|nr:hypothetical protein [Mesomycoplasma neurolyticum]VEU59503.1 Uncharacterised protein [Mesomycoplasma neurolyticum]
MKINYKSIQIQNDEKKVEQFISDLKQTKTKNKTILNFKHLINKDNIFIEILENEIFIINSFSKIHMIKNKIVENIYNLPNLTLKIYFLLLELKQSENNFYFKYEVYSNKNDQKVNEFIFDLKIIDK